METRTSARLPHAEFFPPPPTPRGPSLWLARLVEDRRELVRFWPVIQNMVVQELRVRYQRSILGFVWTLLNPLLMMVTLSCVFSQFTQIEHYSLFLFAGMVPWGFLSNSLNEGAVCIISNEGLIRKIYLPKLVFPVAKVLNNLVTFALSLGALFLLLGPLGARLSLPMLFLPIAIGLFAVFVLGLSLIVATANTFFRDCGHLVSVFLQAWYFLTPILFPINRNQFSENTRWRFLFNPAYYFIELFHEVLYAGQWPRPGLVAAAALIAATSLGIGYVIFKSHEDKMVFRL
jgi:ABC-type polysaccharide/polyol phosphate export permease